MNIFQSKLFSNFVSEWVVFLQKTSVIARKYKKCIESNELLGLYLVVKDHGYEPTWKDFYEELLFLKSADALEEIDEYEIHNHKMFISRYLRKLLDKGLVREMENPLDKRTKKYTLTPIMETIMNEVVELLSK